MTEIVWYTTQLPNRRIHVGLAPDGTFLFRFVRLDLDRTGRDRRQVTRLRTSREAAMAMVEMIVILVREHAQRIEAK